MTFWDNLIYILYNWNSHSHPLPYPTISSLKMATNYTLKRATIQDIPALSEILVSAMAKDALWTQMFRTLSHSEQVAWSNENTGCRFDPGEILGACETWRVVDSSGYLTSLHSSYNSNTKPASP